MGVGPRHAVLRTIEERVTARANNVESVVYPIEIEIRVTITDDDGRGHLPEAS